MPDYSIHEKWMYYALKEAERAKHNNEVHIGAIVVFKDNIIGRGSNQVEALNDATAHAEIIAITSASNTIDDWRLNKCILYVTKQPCIMCMGAILNSRIEKLYYGMHDLDCGRNVRNLYSSNLKKTRINWK